jgi:AraC-like DNA-binding protein
MRERKLICDAGLNHGMSSQFEVRLRDEVLRLLRSNVEPRLLPFFEFCLEHAHERMTVEGLARRFRIHRRALEYRLAQAGLPPPGRVMAWASLIHAAHLFSLNAGTVEAIAEACGYCSPNAMRKSFERVGLRLSSVQRLGGFERAMVSLIDALHYKTAQLGALNKIDVGSTHER